MNLIFVRKLICAVVSHGTVIIQSINCDIPENVKMEDESYTYMDSSDETSIMHCINDTYDEL